MEDAKYCGRDWIPTGNWPQVRYNPAYNRTTPDNLAQVLRCGSSHPSLPLLYLPTSFTLSLSQLGIFQGHYKVWEWLEHIVFMSTSCMFSSHMPYNTLLLHISRNSTHCITRTWHPLSDVVHLTRRDANFHGIAHVGVNRSRLIRIFEDKQDSFSKRYRIYRFGTSCCVLPVARPAWFSKIDRHKLCWY